MGRTKTRTRTRAKTRTTIERDLKETLPAPIRIDADVRRQGDRDSTVEVDVETSPAHRRWRFALVLGIACAQVLPWPLAGEPHSAHDVDRMWRRGAATAREAAGAAAWGGAFAAVGGIELTQGDGALIVDLDVVGDWGVTFALRR
jgi:hypothetical protein